LGASIAAAAFLCASSVGGEIGGFDIASDAFLSAAAEAAGGGSTFSLPTVPEFCADVDCVKAKTIADDFAVIRSRIEELRRERAQVSAERDTRPRGPRPYYAATSALENGRYPRLSRAIRQKLFG
jgi:hypothetical protein